MSHTKKAVQDGPRDARIIEEHHIAGPHREDEIEATDDGRRRWYHLRPVPRRRTDFMGFNTTWWALWWLILVVLLLYPGPYW